MSVKELRQRPFHTEMKLNRSHDTTLDCCLGYWLTWSVYWDLMTSFSLILNLRTWEQANIKQQQQHDFEFIWRSSVFSFHQKFTGIRKCPSNSIKNTEHFVKTLAGPLVNQFSCSWFQICNLFAWSERILATQSVQHKKTCFFLCLGAFLYRIM